MSMGSRVRELRDRQGWSQKELGERVGVEESYIGHIERGRTEMPSPTVLRALAKALDTTTDDLLAAAGLVRKAGTPERKRTPEEVLAELQALMKRPHVELYETEQAASAGAGTTVDPEPWLYYPEPGEVGHRFIVVPVSGDCMEPEIPAGYRVVVDLDASPQHGDTVLAYHEGEALVKILEERDGEWWLVAIKDRPPLKATGETRIAGVVREAKRRIRRR